MDKDTINKQENKFPTEVNDEDKASFHFCVTSDLHVNKDDSKSFFWGDFCDRIKELTPSPQFLAICGDLTDSNYTVEADSIYQQFNYFEKENTSVLICEGHGNHDGDTRMKYPWDKQARDIVTNRNPLRIVKKPDWKWIFYQKKMNYSNHYKWEVPLTDPVLNTSINIHFFMLNNVPGFDTIGKDKKNGDNAHERDPYDSLTFLETELCKLGEKDYYILFFHINFEAEERWWTNTSKKSFSKVIKKSNANYVTSFFGHAHSSSGKKINKTIEEKLTEDDSIYGYRCRCSGGNGSRYFSLVDLFLDKDTNNKNILKCKITPQDTYSDEEFANKLYLLNHDTGEMQTDSASSVTLCFDIEKRIEIDRIIDLNLKL